jgi:hypothetical protein
MEAAVGSSAVRSVPKPRPKRQRSRVTNGKQMFVEGDGRSPWARRWRDLIELHVSDLGGAAALSEAQRSLVKRASTIEIELEQIEGRLSEGKAQDLALYATATAHSRRVFEALGLERKARDMGSIIDGKAVPVEWSPLRARLYAEAERIRQEETLRAAVLDATEIIPP